MKCPKCQKVYSNELSFCLDDGSTLFSDANLSGLGKQMSAETIVINQPTKPIQKNSNKWIFVSISIAAVIIFMTAGVILAWQTINYVKQSNANKPKVILDIDKNGNTQNPNGLDKNDSDETLNLEDAKTLDKLKSEGLLIAQKTPNKPNPLILMVEINSENGDLELNKENVGNILAKNNLGERLSQVFKQREGSQLKIYNNNNTFTDAKDVKVVTISVRPLIKADYFNKTLDILKKSGASPIYLDVEGENNAANTINGCQLPESVNVQSQKIQFSSASYAITPESQTALESIAEDLKKLPADCLIEIGIHTDNVGDVTKNTQLSMARALALKGFLVNKLGVEDRKLSVKGYGSSEPKVSNDTAEGREANRRTEFRLYTKN